MAIAVPVPSSELVVPKIDALDLADLDLADLADRVRDEHRAACDAVENVYMHAVLAGEALLAAKPKLRTKDGSFTRWLDECGLSRQTASRYMRLAYYKNELLAAGEPFSLTKASVYLQGLPAIDQRNFESKNELRSEIIRLRSTGLSHRQIAERVGISYRQVYYHLLPAAERSRRQRERNKAQRTQRRALARLRRENEIRDAVKKAGAALAEAYALSERLQDVLGQASREADAAARVHLNTAGGHYRKMRDEIVRALGVS